MPLTTLDRLVDTGDWPTPFGIKLDAEGFEAQIITGATATLERSQFVIAEISISKRYEGGCSVAEFIALARKKEQTADEIARLDLLKREMAERVMASPATDVYDSV